MANSESGRVVVFEFRSSAGRALDLQLHPQQHLGPWIIVRLDRTCMPVALVVNDLFDQLSLDAAKARKRVYPMGTAMLYHLLFSGVPGCHLPLAYQCSPLSLSAVSMVLFNTFFGHFFHHAFFSCGHSCITTEMKVLTVLCRFR